MGIVMKSGQGNVVWEKSSQSDFETFAVELEEYTRTGVPPSSGSQDVQYGLELQQKRLADKDLKLEYKMVPRGHFASASPAKKSWGDDRYINQLEWRTCRLGRTLSRGGETIYRREQNEMMYETITNAKGENVVGGDLYTCPNCGAVSTIKDLQKGCEYCGTHFKMGDLFPRITNYYFVRDMGGTGTEIKHEIMKMILPCMAVSMVACTAFSYWLSRDLVYSLIAGILGGALFGLIGGYMLWVIVKLVKLFAGAGKAIGVLANSAGSEQKFVRMMSQYSPEFSYEYFSGKVVALLKMIMYAEDAGELTNYEGPPVESLFSDLVESCYYGAVALKGFEVKGVFVYVTVDVYMEDVYEREGRISEQSEKFRMQLCRRADRSVNYNFSIQKIQCKGCGSSFDATRQKICPGCGTRYEIGEDDWIVTYLARL